MVMTSDLYKAFSGYKYKDNEWDIIYPVKYRKKNKKNNQKGKN